MLYEVITLVGTPYGGVKEQGAGIYAQTMAERGFIAVAFDESFNGESSGEPRHVSSPDIFVEDFSAGVDFRITSYNVCYTKLLRNEKDEPFTTSG